MLRGGGGPSLTHGDTQCDDASIGKDTWGVPSTGRNQFHMHRQMAIHPSIPVYRHSGVSGWALLDGVVKRLHVCAYDPCIARYPGSNLVWQPSPAQPCTTTRARGCRRCVVCIGLRRSVVSCLTGTFAASCSASNTRGGGARTRGRGARSCSCRRGGCCARVARAFASSCRARGTPWATSHALPQLTSQPACPPASRGSGASCRACRKQASGQVPGCDTATTSSQVLGNVARSCSPPRAGRVVTIAKRGALSASGGVISAFEGHSETTRGGDCRRSWR